MFTSLLAKGQSAEQNFIYTTTIGTGIAVNEPSYTPFLFHVLGYYPLGHRFSAGVGTGLSFYETMLIPLFADVKFAITQPQKIIPYVECGGGYAFAPNKNANGGLYLNSSVGVQYALSDNLKLQLAAGYELQKLERLKKHTNQYFTAGFAERLNHHILSLKVGIVF